MADKYALATLSVDELKAITPVAGTDKVPVFDVSTNTWGYDTASADLTGVNATAAEINNAADVSARVQELTASGAVTAGVQSVELNKTDGTIAATIADSSNHQGVFIAKATTEPGVGGDHTLTLTAGTFDGTNNVATFADINDALIVYFDSAGNGTIVENVGSVSLS